MWQVFSTALCSTRRRRGRHRWDALRPDKHPAVMARRSGQGMKPLAARACARPLTAPSTMTLLEQPNRARCTINCRIHRSLMERARSRSSAGYRPATLSLDSLVGSLAARIEVAEIEDDVVAPEPAGGVVDRIPTVKPATDVQGHAVMIKRVFEDA